MEGVSVVLVALILIITSAKLLGAKEVVVSNPILAFIQELKWQSLLSSLRGVSAGGGSASGTTSDETIY